MFSWEKTGSSLDSVSASSSRPLSRMFLMRLGSLKKIIIPNCRSCHYLAGVFRHTNQAKNFPDIQTTVTVSLHPQGDECLAPPVWMTLLLMSAIGVSPEAMTYGRLCRGIGPESPLLVKNICLFNCFGLTSSILS